MKRVLLNIIKRAFGELNNVFQDAFNNFYHNSQRMSDSFYHTTESSEFKNNMVSKNAHLVMYVSHILEFLRRNTCTYVHCFDL